MLRPSLGSSTFLSQKEGLEEWGKGNSYNYNEGIWGWQKKGKGKL